MMQNTGKEVEQLDIDFRNVNSTATLEHNFAMSVMTNIQTPYLRPQTPSPQNNKN